METRANYAIIGFFTLAVLVAAFGFVYWFSGGDRGQARLPVRIIFSGSVAGLSKGSVVSFNGIRVGEVTQISLLPEDPRRVVAVVEVDRTTPVRTDTRARLDVSLLSNVGAISLVGGEPGSPPLAAGPGQPLPTIFADRSDVQDLLESARNIARRADETLERINRVVGDNEGGINRTVQNVERFSQTLSDNAPNIDGFLARVGEAAQRIGPLAGKLETLTDEVTGRVRAIDPQRVARTVENLEGFTETLAANRDQVTTILRDAGSLAQRLNESAGRLDATLADVSNVVKAVDPALINNTFTNVEAFSRTLADNREAVTALIRDAGALARSVDPAKVDGTLANLQAFTRALADNREVVTNVLRDAGSLAQRLNETAGRLDATIADVGAVVRAVDPAKISGTVANIEGFSQTLAGNRANLDRIVQDVANLSRAIDPARVSGTLANVEAFTQTLAENRGQVATILRDTGTLAQRLNESAGRLDATLGDIGTLVRSVDAPKLNSAIANVEGFTQTLAQNRENVDRIVQDVGNLTRSIDGARLNNTVANVEAFSKTLADNRENVGAVLRDVSSLARRLNESAPKLDEALTQAANLAKSIDAQKVNSVVANADRFTKALGDSAPDVEKAIDETRSLAEKLNKSADRVDGVLKAAQDFLGAAAGPQGQSTFGEIREAARSIRVLADNLDKRTAEITTGLNRFTGSGRRELESAASDARRTLNDVGRTVRGVERNPQQFLFGGRPNLPQYNGAR